MKNEEIVRALREHAEWAQANEWETPITLSDDLAAAADLLEKLTARCARYAEEIAVAQERTRWIPVPERLPEPSVPRNPAADDPRLKNMTPKFCERVKALREATGLTRKEFAESIGEYPGTYSAWENNSLAGAGSLPKLALTLGTTMDYLCGLTDDPAPKPPTLFSVDLCSPVWLPLDAEHWPTEGALVALSYETCLGGSSYLVARCAGSADDQYPFISTDAGTTVDDIVECRYDRWMPLAECRRGEEGA